MPRTELPSKQPDGSANWVEWTPDWMSSTRLAVKAAVVYEISGSQGGEVTQRTDAANDDRQLVALWAQQITAWSFADRGIPVPSQNVAGGEVIWSTLSGPDFNTLAEATADLFDQVTATPTRRRSGRGSSQN
jgi:hypothetical protein